MKKTLCIVLTLGVCVLVGVGCQSADETKDNKEMRDSMTGKNFDASKAPPEARAIMEKMNTKQTGGKPPIAPSPGPGAPKAGSTGN